MDTVSLHAFEGNPPFVLIPLTKGKFTIVDPEDADLADYRWYVSHDYARRKGRKGTDEKVAVVIHRVILERKLGRSLLLDTVVDHINGNGLDNRRSNLREATTSQNAANAKRGDSRGIKFDGGKWQALIGYQSRVINLGKFDTREQALEAYNSAAVEFFGEFARSSNRYEEDAVWILAKEIAEQQAKNIPAAAPLYKIDENDPSIAYIPINLGLVVIVDSQDLDLSQFRWTLGGRYAVRKVYGDGYPANGQRVIMHRIILERKLDRVLPDGMVVDHINGNGLDNRRVNLREATISQNMQNTRRKGSSGYKGVKKVGPHTWEARVNDRTIGYFDTAKDAAFAYDKAALEQYGEFALLNHPLEEVLSWMPSVRQFGVKNVTGYRGVQASDDRWVASIQVGERVQYLGSFDMAEEAAYAYDKEALRIQGERATLNHTREEVEAWIAPSRILRKTNTSGYRGIAKGGKGNWYAHIRTGKRNIHLGTFSSAEEAARAYDRRAIEMHGLAAKLNFPREDYGSD